MMTPPAHVAGDLAPTADGLPVAPEWAAARLLVAVRTTARLTQRQVAHAAGVPITTLSDYETGRVSPTVEKLAVILTAIGAPLTLTAALPTHSPTITTTGRPDPAATRQHG